MVLRNTLPGCAVGSPEGDAEGIMIAAWDDETGLVLPIDAAAPPIHRGQYVPDRMISASFWPQLADPVSGWKTNITATQVIVNVASEEEVADVLAWDEDSHAVRVSLPAQGNADLVQLGAARRISEIGPDEYFPADELDWPPLNL
jgi:hypothetical protein